jgi:hypothetical protein
MPKKLKTAESTPKPIEKEKSIEETKKGEESAPKPSLETVNKEIVFALEQLQSRFLLITIVYLVSMYIGIMQLVSAVPWIGNMIFALALTMWLVGPTTVFAIVVYRTYQPLKNIENWLDKYIGVEG